MECRDSSSMFRKVACYGLAAGCAIGLPILAYKVTSIIHELCCLGHEAMEHNYGMIYDKRFGLEIGPRAPIAISPEAQQGTPKTE